MRSWSVVEKFSLNCLFDFYFREEYMDRARRRVAGWGRRLVFIFLFFFVNRFVVLPSSLLNARLSSSSHYSTQGFVLISFHFFFF